MSSEVELPWFEATATERLVDVTVRRGPVEVGRDDGATPTACWFGEGEFRLSVKNVARFLVRGGTEVTVDAHPSATLEDIQLFLCGSVFGSLWHQRGVLALHASAVRFGDRCALFAGRAGAGKSTLAAHLERAGLDVVADDVCVISTTDDAVAVWPTVPRLKLDVRSLETLGEDPARLPSAGGSRGKRRLVVRGLQQAPERPVPMGRFYLLDRHDGPPRIETMAGLDALDAVAGHTYGDDLVDPLGCRTSWLRQAFLVSNRVEVRRLLRPWALEAVPSVVTAVLDDLSVRRNSADWEGTL